MEGIYVIKRNGEKEPLQIYKTQKFIYWGCEGIKSVDPQAVLEAANIQFSDGIKTDDITKVIINATVNMIQEETNYQYVAARYVLFDVRKRAYGGFEPISWKEYVERGVAAGMLDKSLREAYTDEELDEINSMLDHSRDFNFTYGGIEQWRMKYCLQNRYTKKIYESPQMTYMRVAAALFSNKPKHIRMEKIRKGYNSSSIWGFSLPTPIMSGAGTPTRQFSSCVGAKIGDDLDAIAESGSAIIRYAARKAGIGFDVGMLRGLGQPIRGGDAIHTGLIPFIKKLRGDLKSCAQGAVRGASATCYFPFWHLEFPELVVLKNNKGIEENRERHLDYGVQINKYFFELAKEPNADMYLFSPEQVPDLYESFFKDQKAFARLYKEYGQRTDITKKTVKAKEMMKLLLGERTDTGRIYLFFVDNANDNGPFDLDTIYHSNLCFSGDTLVAVADGRNAVSIKDLYDELGHGGETLVYSARKPIKKPSRGRKNGGVTYGSNWVTEVKAARIFKTGIQKLVKVTLENGDTFRCTPDHQIALKDGGYEEAQNLVGLHVEPFASFRHERKYRCINSATSGKQHIRIWEYHNGERPEGYHIDHINNEAGDYITNLQILNKDDHFNKTSKEFAGSGNPIHNADKAKHVNDTTYNSFMDRNPRYSGVTDQEIIDVCKKVYEETNSTRGFWKAIESIGGPKSFSKNRFGGRMSNLVSIVKGESEYIAPVSTAEKPVYNKTVSNDWRYIEVGNDLVYQGLKVVSVEDDGVEDVYDLNVDDNHNFYIITSGDEGYMNSKGVLVHNCCEIALPSKPFNSKFDEEGRIFLCTLASMNWGTFKNPEEMESHCQIIVEMLDALLDYQDYPQHQARLATEDYRPLGIGIINLAYFLAKRDMKYGDEAALAEVKKWIEHQTYYLTKASVELAKEYGPCKAWKNTCYSNGVFPWEKRSKGVDELTDFTPSSDLDWEGLRADVMKYGIRNATLQAIAPTETSAQITGGTNGVEPPIELISVKVSKDGTIVHVVPEYKKLKKKYETKWTMGKDGCLRYLKVNAVLAAFVDQAISTNTWYNPNDFKDEIVPLKIPFKTVFGDVYLFHKWSGKSLYYSLLYDGGVEKKESLPTLQSAPIEDEVCEGCTV